MPVFEYRCTPCGAEFELLVYAGESVECPSCGSKDINKKLSVFGMSGVEKPFAGASSGCGSCKKSACQSCS